MTGKIVEKRGRIMGLKVVGRKDSPAKLGVLSLCLTLWALGRGDPPAWTKPIAACPASSDTIPTLKLRPAPLDRTPKSYSPPASSKAFRYASAGLQHSRHHTPSEVTAAYHLAAFA